MAELRVGALEGLEDADGTVRIDQPLPVALDVPELAGGGVIEGQDHGRGPAGQGQLAVEEVAEGDEPVAALPQALEVPAEIGRGARPALLGGVDLVVLEDHDPPELVGRQGLGGGG